MVSLFISEKKYISVVFFYDQDIGLNLDTS